MPYRLRFVHYAAAVLIAAAVCAIAYSFSLIFPALQSSSASQIVDLIFIGACAFTAALIGMKCTAERRSRAREKIILVAELNHHIRNAVTLLGQSAALPDGPEKLQMIDAAVDRIDRVLTELVPTANTTDVPRLFLDERVKGAGPQRKK